MDFSQLGLNSPLLMLFKILLLTVSVIYGIFAVVVLRQISVMKKTLITPMSGKITILGWVHLAFAGIVIFTFWSL